MAVFFMAGSHIAHDCTVGDHVICANGAQVGGHVQLGDSVFFSAAYAPFINIRALAISHLSAAGAIVVSDIIPYASAVGNHARLVGLNIIGMKRRGMARDVIHDLRAAYRMLHESQATFKERVQRVRERYGDREEVNRILEFVEYDSSRPLMPAR